MQKVLFVRGYDTYLSKSSGDEYAVFYNLFRFDKHHSYRFNYFNYSSNEPLPKVYARLAKSLNDSTYDIIVSHSLGGLLTVKYFHQYPTQLKKCKKVILLMPLICERIDGELISNFLPIVRCLSLPKGLLLPKQDLNSDFGLFPFLEDWITLISLQQLVDAFNFQSGFILDLSVLIAFLNAHCQKITIIYALGDKLAVIPPAIRNKIKNIHYVLGNHEAFNESQNSTFFFKVFKRVLLN